MDLNPGIDPRNLYIGQVINIRPGYQYNQAHQGTQRNMRTPVGMGTPQNTGTPGSMRSPGSMGAPQNTGTPGGMRTPDNTGMPGSTRTPVSTGAPQNAGSSGSMRAPAGMGTPDNTGMPGNTRTPVNTGRPQNTGTPGNAATPGNMGIPGGTSGTGNPVMPGIKRTPVNTDALGNMGRPDINNRPSYLGNIGFTDNMEDMNNMDNMNNMNDMNDMDNMDNMDGVDQDLDQLINYFHMLWEQHVFWTRMTVMGIIHDLPESQQITQRLLRNPVDFANALLPFYGTEAANNFKDLLTAHLMIAAELVKAAKDGDNKAVADANKRWYENADEIAKFLNNINEYWSEDDWSAMLYEHLELLSENVLQMIAGEYEQSINGFDDIEMQALEMADMMAEGIAMQFSEL